MIFDKIIDVTKIVLGEHDILAKTESASKSGLTIISKEKGLSEETNEYAVINTLGADVDPKKFAVGNVILAGNGGRNNKSFEWKGGKYIIFSDHSIGIMTTPDNFELTKSK